VGIDGDALARTSRLVAKVDSAAVQDGFDLYLHAFVVTDEGRWVVVQQGMDTTRRQARRYHWLSEGVDDFVDTPHAAIDGPNRGEIINLTDHRAKASKQAQLELVSRGPESVLAVARRLRDDPEPLFEAAAPIPRLSMPAHHDVRPSAAMMRRLHGALTAAADAGPRDCAELLLQEGIGARTVATLALVSEVVYGAPSRFSDPARHSMALGGKDGHPFPVPLDVYDATIGVLRRAVERARLGEDDRLVAIRRLDEQARALESGAGGPDFHAFVAEERRRSAEHGGRTVSGPARSQGAPKTRVPSGAPRAKRVPRNGQLDLPGLGG